MDKRIGNNRKLLLSFLIVIVYSVVWCICVSKMTVPFIN